MPDDAQDTVLDADLETADTNAADETAVSEPDPQTAALDSALEDLLGPDTADEALPSEDERGAGDPIGAVAGIEATPAAAELSVAAPADTAPADAPVLDPADAAFVEAVTGGLTWIPFAVYLGLWIVLAGLSAYLLYGATPDQPARWMPEYVPLVWSGVGLTALGPILSVIVWLVARTQRPKSGRRGLFASAMTRGALVAFFGVAVWIATLFVLELTASGGAL